MRAIVTWVEQRLSRRNSDRLAAPRDPQQLVLCLAQLG
jgi:hypothetical protein